LFTVVYEDDDEESDNTESQNNEQCCERVIRRVPWSTRDLKILSANFSTCTKAPNAAMIRKVVAQNPSLSSRTLAQIKSRAWALICKKTA